MIGLALVPFAIPVAAVAGALLARGLIRLNEWSVRRWPGK
jgi:hypothetical protein